jgi:predicted TPR repeat methyltransferase
MSDPARLHATMLAGLAKHQAGDAAAALADYRAVLAQAPEHPDALNLGAQALRAIGRIDEALEFAARACAALPHNATFHANRAAILFDAKSFDAARDAAAAAIAADATHAPGWINRAVARAALGDDANAESDYRRALTLAPGAVEARNNLGNLLQRQGRIDEALSEYEAAIAANPHHREAHSNYGTALYALQRAGDGAKAAALAREWAGRFPESATARHIASALAGGDVAARAPDAYVRDAFDMFAPTFEATLAKLDYRAPQVLDDLLAQHLKQPLPVGRALDAGCGTGLAAPMLRGRAAILDGVDLSGGMVARARERKLYDELRVGELIADLKAHEGAYDLIVAADVLCYFGDLADVLAAASSALKAGGGLAFSVERLIDARPDETWRVRPSGRYAHAAAALPALLRAAGFANVAIEPESTRSESGAAVPGAIAWAEKA